MFLFDSGHSFSSGLLVFNFIRRLEDHGVITTCGIPTLDPEVPVVHDFNEEIISTVSMKVLYVRYD